ncbi:MAG: oligosaccharide flippase family protein [Hyphomicrobium sp.]|nr:oligosaccharide flippase family protein [Hyphomicrobium sp.]
MNDISFKSEAPGPTSGDSSSSVYDRYDAGSTSIRIMALTASFWALCQNAAPKLVSFFSFIVMAHYLTPDEIGIAAAIGAYLAFAELICEQGLGETLVQRRDVTHEDSNLVFWTILGVGVLTGFVTFFGAGYIAEFLRAPELETYIRVTAIYLPIAGLGVVQQSIYKRRLDYKWLGLRSAVAAIISGVVAVVVAWLGGGSWALITQITAFGALSAMLLWIKAPFKPSFRISLKNAASIFSFSSAVAGTRLIEFVALRAIEFIILARLGAAALGAYFLGAKLAQTALHLISPPLIDVAHALFSGANHHREQARELYFRVVVICGLTAVPIMAQLSALSMDVATTVYGSNGALAAPVLGYLSGLGALWSIQYVNVSFASASGRPIYNMSFALLRAVLTTTLLILVPVHNVIEIVLIFAVAEALLFPISIWLISMLCGISIAAWISRVGATLAAAGIMYATMVAIGDNVLHDLPSLLRILILAPLGAATFAFVVWALDGKRTLELLRGNNLSQSDVGRDNGTGTPTFSA